MSFFIVDAGDSNTPTHHAATINRDSLLQTTFARMGLLGKPNSGKPIAVYKDLKNKAGETIYVHFVPFADKDPLIGQDVTIDGNEYKFDEFNTNFSIDEYNFPFKVKGRMTEQRTILNARNELRRQIVDHFSDWNDKSLFLDLVGINSKTENSGTYTSATDTTDRINGANRCVRASGTNSYATVTAANSDNTAVLSAMEDNDLMNPRLIMGAEVIARRRTTSNPYRMQSIKTTKAGEWFVLFVGPNSSYDLKTNAEWFARSVAVNEKGIERDPIAMGALGTINKVMIHEAEHIVKFGTAGSDEVERNIMLGQNAAALAFSIGGGQGGEMFQYTEMSKDYKRELGATGTQIRGQHKLNFTNKDNTSETIDYGVMQVLAAANDPS